MELTMGTPISKTAIQVLREFFGRGVTPDNDTLSKLGIDKILLRHTHASFRSAIGWIDGFRPLEDACKHARNHRTWTTAVRNSPHKDARVLRFATSSIAIPGLLRLESLTGDHDIEIEVFLTRMGEWIVWYGGKPHENYRDVAFTKHTSVDEVLKRLENLRGDRYRYSGSSSVAFQLREGLIRFLEESIDEKQRRLDSLKELHADFKRADMRNDLNG